MRMDEGPTSQGPKVQMWDACPRSKLAVCAGQSSRDKQAWHLPGERDHAVHTSIHWRPIIHTRGPSGEVGPTVSTSIYWKTSRGSGPTAYTSVYWGTTSRGAHCLHFHLLGNLQGKWAPLYTPPATGGTPGEVGPIVYTFIGEPPGEVGFTVYTSIYWVNSRVGGANCLHLCLLGNLQERRETTVYTSIH